MVKTDSSGIACYEKKKKNDGKKRFLLFSSSFFSFLSFFSHTV